MIKIEIVSWKKKKKNIFLHHKSCMLKSVFIGEKIYTKEAKLTDDNFRNNRTQLRRLNQPTSVINLAGGRWWYITH